MNRQDPRLCSNFSLEMSAKDLLQVSHAARTIPEGTAINVAFLGNETFEQRLDAIRVVTEHRLVAVPIVSARRMRSSNELVRYLAQAGCITKSARVFLVGGDPPVPQGPFADSMDLINCNILEKFAISRVGIAGYPEGHPKVNSDVLWDYLQRKVQCLED